MKPSRRTRVASRCPRCGKVLHRQVICGGEVERRYCDTKGCGVWLRSLTGRAIVFDVLEAAR